MRGRAKRCAIVAIAIAFAAPARAQHVDVLFYELDGRVATGATDFGPPFELRADERVFPVKLDLATGGGVALSPGFTADANPPAGAPLPPLAPIPFFAEPVAQLGGRTLSYWNGTGDVAFEPTPNGERIRIKETGCFVCGTAFIASESADLPTFPLGTTGANGGLHYHPEFALRSGAGSIVAPPAGIYLLALRAEIDGLEPSEPFFIPFGERVTDQALADAATWVELNLLPEPGALLAPLTACGLLAALHRRRRSAELNPVQQRDELQQ